MTRPRPPARLISTLGFVLAACSGSTETSATTEPSSAGTSTGTGASPVGSPVTSTGNGAGSGAESPSATGETPASLSRGLLLAYSMFPVVDGQVQPTQGRARVELLIRENGAWRVDSFEDPGSNVFHKAMPFTPPGGQPGILTLSGMSAAVKLWRHGPNGWTSETLWTEEFGGRFNRMRDAEVGNLFGDGDALAIATHDQGVTATIRWQGGAPQVARIDARPNTFVHEIELGDLNGDGQIEVYATPSDPNDLDGGEQRGEVVRYVPGASSGGERTVVADLGNRHAKEIWVGDVDGDGRDELYVAVEALTRETGGQVQIVEPVEIRRYDADTPPNAGVVIATIQDRLTRFLTVGDVDGDGRREMVAAAFSSGLWLLRPGTNPRSEWASESIDRESSGFEHASILTDLDGDRRDELYVAADNQGEVRRYVWVNGRPRREVIHRRDNPRTAMTWNIVPFDVSLAR
ncbi:MAG: hypothetical protein OHK0013_04650 [Sandaracinaceae bacterium]